MRNKRAVLAGLLLLTLFMGVGGAAAAPVTQGDPVATVDFTGAGIAALFGAVLSLVLSWVPGLRVGWAELVPNGKRWAIIAATGLISIAVFLLGAAGLIALDPEPAFDLAGLANILPLWAAAYLVAQGIYLGTPQPEDVTHAKRQLRP